MSAGASEPILLAFSGGGDSRALLQRALDVANGRPVIAAIVDHGLRAGSAAEAARASDAAREAGAAAQVLTLDWPQGPKPSQAAARAGRFHALTAFARQQGAASILLAHTMDDQAETVLIRLAQGSGWRGLAGMAADAPAPLWPAGRGLRLRRPLLNTRRAQLRSALTARGVSWIEDPSNQADRFQRVRARARLADWEGGDLGVARWAGLAARLAPLASALDAKACALIAEAATFDEGAILLSAGHYRGHDPEVRVQALAAILVAVSGAGLTADSDQLERLDRAIAEGAARGATLGGARLAARADGRLQFNRDPGAVLGRAGGAPLAALKLRQNAAIIWDGRLALTAAEDGWEAAPGADACAPVLRKPGENAALTLGEATQRGLVAAEWLLQERIAHLLWR